MKKKINNTKTHFCGCARTNVSLESKSNERIIFTYRPNAILLSPSLALFLSFCLLDHFMHMHRCWKSKFHQTHTITLNGWRMKKLQTRKKKCLTRNSKINMHNHTLAQYGSSQVEYSRDRQREPCTFLFSFLSFYRYKMKKKATTSDTLYHAIGHMHSLLDG